MSDYQIVCDAIKTDLVGNVAGLFDAEVHLYEPWDPEALVAAVGEKHLAIWPVAEQADSAEVIATGFHLLTQQYEIWYWEGAETENERMVRDEAAALKLLDLHNAVRARFYVEENQALGGSKLVWYTRANLPNAPSLVRWFRIVLRVERLQAFT